MSAARTIKNSLLSLTGLAVVWFLAVAIPLWIAALGNNLFSLRLGPLRFAGWIPIFLGSGVILWCYGTFIFIGGGTPWPFAPPKRLVVAGFYRFTRNPMEGGCLLVVLGETLLLESPAVLLYLVFGFLLLHIRQVAIEEPILRRRFGQSYEQYCRSVPRWVPRLRVSPGKGEGRPAKR